MRRTNRHSSVLWAALLAAALSVHAAAPKSPDLVNTALKIFAGVYGDMDRKLAAGQYDRLPHENQEFQDGAAAMRDAIAKEPAAFKTKVESQLKKTLADSAKVAETSKSHDEGQVKMALQTLSASLQALNALFPENLRVAPGSVPPPRGPGGPPTAAN
jgi:cytochrome c556